MDASTTQLYLSVTQGMLGDTSLVCVDVTCYHAAAHAALFGKARLSL